MSCWHMGVHGYVRVRAGNRTAWKTPAPQIQGKVMAFQW